MCRQADEVISDSIRVSRSIEMLTWIPPRLSYWTLELSIKCTLASRTQDESLELASAGYGQPWLSSAETIGLSIHFLSQAWILEDEPGSPLAWC